MFNPDLSAAVEELTIVMLLLSEQDLEQEWRWKDHDDEGIRYEAHFTQHTVQIDKTLVAIGFTPSESMRLLRRT